MNINYQRVIPRDFFNESKLLKCLGQLSLLIHDNKAPVEMKLYTLNEDTEPFKIGLNFDGSLELQNWYLEIKGIPYIVSSTYNSKSPYPLFVLRDAVEYEIFNDDGTFSDEFINFSKKIVPNP